MELKHCRLCCSTNLIEVLDLGNQYITSRFPLKGDYNTPLTKIRLVMCLECNLCQLKDTTPSFELYEHLYGYRSGISHTMRTHLKEYNDEIQTFISLEPNDYVLDIGSNDSTFLQYYSDKLKRYGCDPTGKQFMDYYNEVKLIPTYFSKETIQMNLGNNIHFKVISSISMFYDLPDPVQFAKDIYDLLDNNGIWTLEQSYVLTMLERNSIDTICHEHLEYYGLKQIKEIMDRSGFKIFNISLNNCNGGSFRIYVCKKENNRFEECLTEIEKWLENENQKQIHTPQRYLQFFNECTKQVNTLKDFINYVNKDNKKVYIYGASTKGNCLLQFGNIDSSYIQYAVERNPLKYGRTTSTGIEIISEETMRENPPEYLLVLPYHFKNEIIEREKIFLEKGGTFIFPFPEFELYSMKPRCLITGIDGQIGQYLVNILINEYNLYGITRNNINNHKNVLKLENNMKDKDKLEKMIVMIKPNHIIHLASITLTEECEQNPLDTLHINGTLTGYLCEIIYKNNLNCNLFNASSSEMYKGHIDYFVKEDDSYYNPTTIYGISKVLGHQLIQHYRNKYHLPFSNGILFTTESSLRKSSFLLKKVVNHAKKWNETNEVLELGSLESYRNILHTYDAAQAIKLIIKQSYGNDYIISNLDTYKVEYIVILLYKYYNIELDKKENIYYDKLTGKAVLKVGSELRNVSTKINGLPTKLLELGWNPMYCIDDIVRMM
jgi:GDP-D-mannose dehydratase